MIPAFAIVAVTADGLIARGPDHLASWTSKEDKDFFVRRTKEAGVMIMGSKTFETIGKPLKDRLIVVYSRQKKQYNLPGVEVADKPPAELLHDLEIRGYKEAAVCGGSGIYTLFAKAGALDRLYVTMEPLLFGAGVTIFNESLDIKLRLEDVQKLSPGVVLLEYHIEHGSTDQK